MCVEEIGRAGISEQKRYILLHKPMADTTRNALRRHLEQDVPTVIATITQSMKPHSESSMGGYEEALREAESGCRCAEAWIGYGLSGE